MALRGPGLDKLPSLIALSSRRPLVRLGGNGGSH